MKSLKPFLLLSIRRIHADRIFSGVKEFELRRTLPNQPFGTVFLYESGAAQIIGCFEPGEPINKAVPELWKVIGERATPKERFINYFGGRERGWAIPIRTYLQFSTPLPTPKLTATFGFRPPVSSMLVRPGTTLFQILAQKTASERNTRKVTLHSISRKDLNLYVSLVTKEIAPKYDEITEEFARAAIRSHKLGRDPNGIFTVKKEVLAIESESGKRIGFTTLTSKIGGCVKTGPTVLLTSYRAKGNGLATRRAIEQHVLERGGRKLYCTCPDNDPRILMHLLTAGFQIEAHLRQHYSRSHGEIVMGKVLVASTAISNFAISRPGMLTMVPKSSRKRAAKTLLQDALRTYWGLSSQELVRTILAKAAVKNQPYEKKPVHLALFKRGRMFCGAAVLIPKRGGAVKVLWFPCDGAELIAMVGEIELLARQVSRRKIYFVHPADDLKGIDALKSSSFSVEGYLKEPYTVGRDAVILSRSLT